MRVATHPEVGEHIEERVGPIAEDRDYGVEKVGKYLLRSTYDLTNQLL